MQLSHTKKLMITQAGSDKQRPHGLRRNPYYQGQAILSQRDHSVAEVRRKLARKKFSKLEIETTIVRLTKEDLLNDARFAQTYSESVLKSKAVGPRWLRAKLAQKGVPTAIVSAAMQAAFTENREAELLRQAAQRWQRQHSTSMAARIRLARFLASRGFSSELIQDYMSSGYQGTEL